MTKIYLFLVLMFSLLFFGCVKFEDYPLEPQIEYQDFVFLIDDSTNVIEKGILSFSYQDGDGDIGLNQEDTIYPFNFGSEYYYNLLVRYFEKQNGTFVEVPLLSWNSETQVYDTSTFNSRIPRLLPEGEKRAIKGVVENELFINNPFSDFDTIMFKVKIVDRSLNVSNEIETAEIVRKLSN